MSPSDPLPIEIHAHLDSPDIPVDSLSRRLDLALPHCLAAVGDAVPPEVAELDLIEVSLVSDETIAGVHGEFMDDPTPTDVITFPHGEILISVDTAIRSGAEHGHRAEREALLYLVHGLLHLNGHDDLSEPARTRMHAEQERILDLVWPFPEAEVRG